MGRPDVNVDYTKVASLTIEASNVVPVEKDEDQTNGENPHLDVRALRDELELLPKDKHRNPAFWPK